MKELNLIPSSIKEKRKKIYNFRQVIALCVIGAAVLFAIAYTPFIVKRRLDAKAEEMRTEITYKNTIMAEKARLDNEIATYKKIETAVNTVKNNRTASVKVMNNIQKLVPNDIRIDSFTYADKTITMQCSTDVYNSIAEFEANVETSPNFKSVKVNSIAYNDTSKNTVTNTANEDQLQGTEDQDTVTSEPTETITAVKQKKYTFGVQIGF